MGTGPIAIMLVILGILVTISLVLRPEIGLMIMVVLIFTRASDVLVHVHGAPSVAKLFVPLLTFIILIRWGVFGNRPKNWDRTVLLLGGYAILGMLSLLYAEHMDRVQFALIAFAKDSLILIILVILLRTAKSLRQVFWALLAAGIFLGAISTYQHLTSSFNNIFWGFGQASQAAVVTGSNIRGYRVGGPGLGFNDFGRTMLFIVPLAIDRLLNEKKIVLRLLAGLALALSIVTIFFTYSRGTVLGLIVVIIFYAISWRPTLSNSVIIGLIALVVIQFLPVDYTQRFLELRELIPNIAEPNAEEITPFRGRISENMVAWQMFQDNPLLGVGLNNYKPLYQSYSVDIGLDTRSEERSPHSVYLEILAELGLLGFVWFVVLQWVTFSGLIKAQRDFQNAGMVSSAGMCFAIEVSLIGFLITGLFLHNTNIRLFWMMYGLALVVPFIAKNELVSTYQRLTSKN